MKTYLKWAIVVIVAAWAGPSVIRYFRYSSLRPPPSIATQRKIITVSQFKQIQHGMTYDEVVGIIGIEGILEGTSKVQDDFGNVVHLETYSWKNGSFGGFMDVTFQNGRVGMKTQHRLPSPED